MMAMDKIQSILHEDHELMKDISRLEDKNDKLLEENKKAHERVEALEDENHRMRMLTDQLELIIQRFIRQVKEQNDLIMNQQTVINELEKERSQWKSRT